MKRLPSDAFARAKAFLESNGRPLERALGRFHFEGGDPEPVRSALEAFRNHDGGFGHGIEPDIRCAESGPYPTGFALATMRDVGLAKDDPLVAGAIDYLASTLDASRLVWPALPPEAQDAPHAPWWGDDGTGVFARLEETFAGFKLIPRVAIVDALVSFDAGHRIPMLDRVIDDTLATIATAPPSDFGGGSTAFIDSVRLVSNAALASERREPAARQLARHLSAVMATNPDAHDDHACAPLSLLPVPAAEYAHPAVAAAARAPEIASAVERHLDEVIRSHGADGAWYPAWTWMGSHPEVWERARIEWAGVVTLARLRSLRAYGRLEG